ncbi:MAG: cation transporter [Clostridiales bacterium]|nr:cation transporter [Clostridiales bacterium]
MTKTYRVSNLDCANCAAKLEKALNKIDGVNSASVSFFAQKITLDMDDANFDSIIENVRKVCKKTTPEMEAKFN